MSVYYAKNVLAFDIGASGGRAILGSYDQNGITLREVHRFPNDPVILNGTMYWDFLRLFHEIKQGLMKGAQLAPIDSIAVDTWGVDFGLVDAGGNLLENPVHYRDNRTAGMLEKSFAHIPKERFYSITGNQFMEINTAFQLLSLREERAALLQSADAILLTPDLFHYFLCGKQVAEMSIASTTQLFDAEKRDWSWEVIHALGLPQRIFPAVVPCGTVLGQLSDGICAELKIAPAKVVAVAGHDTQSAMAATPAREKDFIFLSCGTWSLLGTELDAPLINAKSRQLNLTNECGFGGKASFLKNIIGLWLIQETRRQWRRDGKDVSFAGMEAMARSAEPQLCFINPDDPVFVPAGNIPERIREYCRKTGQHVPESDAQVLRCVYESLALTYRRTVGEIEDCTAKRYDTMYIVGGGAQDSLLCELTASVSGRRVSAGPVEATALGNIAVQLIALGELEGIRQAREIIRGSGDIRQYRPGDSQAWERAYQRFLEVTSC